MLPYVDDASIFPRSPWVLPKVMEVIVEVSEAFTLTALKKKTENLCNMPSPSTPPTIMRNEAAGQTWKELQSFPYYS